MKRKFISILLVLVLALSLSLVTAIPVAADPGTLYVVPFTLSNVGTGTAEWSDTEYHTGSYSIKLYAPASTGDYGKVVMPLDMEFEALLDFSVWVEGGTTAQALPLHDIKAVVDDVAGVTLPISNKGTGLDVDLQNKIVVLASQPGQSEALSPTLMSDGIDGWEKYGTHSDATINVGGTDEYWSIFVYSASYVYEAAYDYYTWDEIHSVLDGKATVTEVRIELRYPQDPADVASTVYVDDITINDTIYYGHIGNTVAIATAGDTIVMAAGTYTADISIPAGKDNLELKPATGAAVTIKGVETEPDTSFPLAVPNIDILSPGVKIHGFTIEGPDAVTDEYASGMLIGAANVEIYDNDFKVTAGRATWAGPVSTGIVTYRKTAIPTVDISGLNIHDNTFTNHGTGAAGFDAIFINIDAGTGTATIADNEFTGNVARAISAERSNMVISGNSIVTDLAPHNGSVGGFQGMFIGCFAVDSVYPAQSDVSVTGNTVKGATTSSEGFAQGIRVGHTSQTSLTNITVLRNTVQDCDEGITVRADATGVTVSYNDITGNTVGVQNDDTGVELDAQYNWYGGVAGPDIGTNPYQTEAHLQGNDSVSVDVDYLPWMIHDTLVAGWNIWSMPIAPATGLAGEPDTNTVAEALDFWTADSSKVIDAYCFNSATQTWAVPTSLTPLQAVYLNLSAAATIDVCVSDSNYAPPGRTMHLGWNLVGTADWDDDKLVHFALEAAYNGTGAVDLVGYQYVISPSIHQTSWTFVRSGTPDGKYFVPTEGYWVYMVNQGILNGFTYTPIVEVP